MRLIDAYRATLPEGELAPAEELQTEPDTCEGAALAVWLVALVVVAIAGWVL